jgi:hypothetical protein
MWIMTVWEFLSRSSINIERSYGHRTLERYPFIFGQWLSRR